ncbi:MAG: nitrous oxide-stimulated promoter family protein [Spirochaetia bacterium]|nr:nitrous oxide-stimulated promoter family protein [Spirochaetia bacterium]
MRRLRREQRTVAVMIAMYCQNHHHSAELCPDCSALLAYAESRIKSCRFGSQKPSCVKCPIHCYKTDKREQIRQIMRFAGPRMLFRHPVLAFFHLSDSLRSAPGGQKSV